MIPQTVVVSRQEPRRRSCPSVLAHLSMHTTYVCIPHVPDEVRPHQDTSLYMTSCMCDTQGKTRVETELSSLCWDNQ